MASPRDLSPVQASALNAPPEYKSQTELARQIAANLGWLIHAYDGSIFDSSGHIIALNLESLADAAQQQGWFHPEGAGIAWGAIGKHDPGTAAEKIWSTLGYPKERPWA